MRGHASDPLSKQFAHLSLSGSFESLPAGPLDPYGIPFVPIPGEEASYAAPDPAAFAFPPFYGHDLAAAYGSLSLSLSLCFSFSVSAFICGLFVVRPDT
jgi:hypothetical protein